MKEKEQMKLKRLHRPIAVVVEAEDVREVTASMWLSEHCPIANAVRRMFPQAERVAVGIALIIVRYGGKTRRFVQNKKAQKFRRLFDSGAMDACRSQTPFRFTLREEEVWL